MNPFEQSAQSWQEILSFIEQTSLGKEVLNRFFSVQKTGRLRVRAYPSDLKSELLAALSPGCPLGAAFITDGYEGQILYDEEGELGILVPYIFHEIIHSLDFRLWDAAGRTLNLQDRNDLILSSECRAFAAQHDLQVRLKTIYPDLETFHKDRYPHLIFLNRSISTEEIAVLYQLSKK